MDVSQYLEIFIDESNEHLQSLSDQLMILEKEPENSDIQSCPFFKGYGRYYGI